MRLVLLPGLNGSSRLFAPLLDHLTGISCQALELPSQGAQDHDSLTDLLIEQLGATSFILLGESFSGPLAYRLAQRQPEELRGLILAASFLQNPHPLTALASRLPVSRLPAPSWLLRLFCTGDVDPEMVLLLQEEIRNLPSALVKSRLAALAQLKAPAQQLALPTLHLRPTRDLLVTGSAVAGITESCSNLRQTSIEGPHFLLQSRPQASAQAIRKFMAEMSD